VAPPRAALHIVHVLHLLHALLYLPYPIFLPVFCMLHVCMRLGECSELIPGGAPSLARTGTGDAMTVACRQRPRSEPRVNFPPPFHAWHADGVGPGGAVVVAHCNLQRAAPRVGTIELAATGATATT